MRYALDRAGHVFLPSLLSVAPVLWDPALLRQALIIGFAWDAAMLAGMAIWAYYTVELPRRVRISKPGADSSSPVLRFGYWAQPRCHSSATITSHRNKASCGSTASPVNGVRFRIAECRGHAILSREGRTKKPGCRTRLFAFTLSRFVARDVMEFLCGPPV